MTNILIHLGYPKSMSTSLQRGFFSDHSGINFAGVGIGDNISYASPELEYIFEVLLKYSRHSHFRNKLDWAQEAIRKFILEDKLNVFSSEYLVMSLSPQEIDPEDKINRLNALFEGFEKDCLLVHREKESLIRSLHGELVKLGMHEDYSWFRSWVDVFEDRSFLYDLDLTVKCASLDSSFKNVHVLEFEELARDNSLINVFFATHFGLCDEQITLPRENLNLDGVMRDKLRKENFENRRGIGRSIYHPFEMHRNRTLGLFDGKILNESEWYDDARKKRLAFSRIID